MKEMKSPGEIEQLRTISGGEIEEITIAVQSLKEAYDTLVDFTSQMIEQLAK